MPLLPERRYFHSTRFAPCVRRGSPWYRTDILHPLRMEPAMSMACKWSMRIRSSSMHSLRRHGGELALSQNQVANVRAHRQSQSQPFRLSCTRKCDTGRLQLPFDIRFWLSVYRKVYATEPPFPHPFQRHVGIRTTPDNKGNMDVEK